MKTMFICSERKINEHVDEEYDYILEVTDEPTTENVAELADRIRTRIRSLWMEQVDAKDDNLAVSVNLHGPSPYNAMLINLKIMMKDEEGIELSLDYPHDELRTTEDPEANALIDKLNTRNI